MSKKSEEYIKAYSTKTCALYSTLKTISNDLCSDLDNVRQEAYEAGVASAQEELEKLKKQIAQQDDINKEYYYH